MFGDVEHARELIDQVTKEGNRREMETVSVEKQQGLNRKQHD